VVVAVFASARESTATWLPCRALGVCAQNRVGSWWVFFVAAGFFSHRFLSKLFHKRLWAHEHIEEYFINTEP